MSQRMSQTTVSWPSSVQRWMLLKRWVGGILYAEVHWVACPGAQMDALEEVGWGHSVH
jgi:hypothetical protein